MPVGISAIQEYPNEDIRFPGDLVQANMEWDLKSV
jgi:hypothetical protein